MSDSTTNLDILSTNAQQELAANALFNSASPSILYARRESTTTGLTWGYYGGKVLIGGVATSISNGTVALTASQTNYVEVNNAGAVSKNTTAFTAGSIPLYTVVAGASTITSYTDHRLWGCALNPRASINMATDANKTLTMAESRADILNITSTTLTVTRDIVLPLAPKMWLVNNATTGGQSIRFIGTTGTGTTIPNGARAVIYSDGTNIVPIGGSIIVDTTISEGINLITGATTGTKIGTAVTQKLGLWGVTPVVQPASANQAVVTLGNTDAEIGGLTISAAYDQTEVQALRDKCEELADDVRNLSVLLHQIRSDLVTIGSIKGSA